MRLFIAINFNEEITKEIVKVIEQLKARAVKGNFTREKNIHLTLVFIGETLRVDEVKQLMDSIKAKAFKLKIKGVGKFPRKGGDIYWLGVEDNHRLNSIADQLRNKLSAAGFSIDDKPFKPHLTLGREVILEKDFAIEELEKTMKILNTEVQKISLMKSERIEGKLVYTEIYVKPLS